MARQGWNEEDTYKVQDATSWGGFAGRAKNPDGSPGGIASGAQQDVNRYRGMGAVAAQRQAYQNSWGNANAYARQAQGARGAQGLALALQAQAAMGGAPSQAQALGQDMLDQSLNAQMAGAASARGGSLAQAAAMRSASQQAAGMQMQGANQLSALRAQEMAQARGDFMQGASGMRGQDFQAQGLAQQQNAMDMQSELTQRGLNQQAQMGYEQLGYNVNEAQQDAALQRYGMDQQLAERTNQRNYERKRDSDNRAWNVVGGAISGFGGFLSDERTKMPLGIVGAPIGYAAMRAGQPGDMFVPDIAPVAEDWEKFGKPGEKNMTAAMSGGDVASVDWARGGADQKAKDEGSAASGILGGLLRAAGGRMSLSDMVAKQPMMLSDMIGKAPLGYSDKRAKMPTGVMGYEDDARIGADGLGYVERPVNESVVPTKFATMQAAKESGSAAPSLAKAAAKSGSRKMTLDEMSAWAERELAKYRGENERLDRGEYKSALADAVERSRTPMASAARAMQASPYAYRPGMEPPEQAPGEPNVGPMAQNMAANPVTATAVKQDQRTGLLMIDQGKMTKVLGGVVADQQSQIDGLKASLAVIAAKRKSGG
jgi:hypothetical protein